MLVTLNYTVQHLTAIQILGVQMLLILTRGVHEIGRVLQANHGVISPQLINLVMRSLCLILNLIDIDRLAMMI